MPACLYLVRLLVVLKVHQHTWFGGRDQWYRDTSLTNINPFLPNLATAALACWPEVAVRQLQKADSSKPKGCNLPCRAHSIFKFRKQTKSWMVISVMQTVRLLGEYFSIDHMTSFKCLFWSCINTKHYVLSHFLSCTQFICWKIITIIIGFFVRTLFLSAVVAVIVKAKHSQIFWKHTKGTTVMVYSYTAKGTTVVVYSYIIKVTIVMVYLYTNNILYI